jgi:hypothetical protein
MHNPDSDYAFNKRSEHIAYRSVDGSTIEIRPEDCPDFERWKAFSDAAYHDSELLEQRTTRRNVSMFDLPDREAAIEDIPVFDEPSPNSRTIENAMAALGCLTETQRRRYLLHVRDGLTTRQIAQADRVSQHAVMGSLHESERRIKIYLKNAFSNGPKNED